jgi:broad specificity phosphatase PhoE
VRALREKGGAAVFSHYVAINAVISHLDGDERVLVFRPDHASISTLETDGERLTLVERGREASTQVL